MNKTTCFLSNIVSGSVSGFDNVLWFYKMLTIGGSWVRCTQDLTVPLLQLLVGLKPFQHKKYLKVQKNKDLKNI